MSLVLNRNFAGTTGASYANGDDADFDNVAGTAPTYQDTANLGVKALRFAAAAQSIVGETFTSTTVRTMSRVWKLSANPASNGEVIQVRSSGARGPGVIITSAGKLILTNVNGTTLATSSASVPTGTEFRVTFTVNGTALSVKWFPDTTSTTPTETVSGTGSGSVNMVTVRDGHLTSTGLGTGVTLDVSWPQDESTTADPGPRSYPLSVSGVCAASADSAGAVTALASVSGSVDCSSSGSLTASALAYCSGSVSGSTSVSLSVNLAAAVAGQSSVVGSSSLNVTVQQGDAFSASGSVVSTSGTALSVKLLATTSGSVPVSSSGSGVVTALRGLAGQTAVASDTSAEVTSRLAVSGQSAAQTSTDLVASALFPVSGEVVAVLTVSLDLRSEDTFYTPGPGFWAAGPTLGEPYLAETDQSGEAGWAPAPQVDGSFWRGTETN